MKWFHLYRTKGLFWFRFFRGYGFHGKDIRLHPPLFSDRYRRRLRIGNWIFKILKP